MFLITSVMKIMFTAFVPVTLIHLLVIVEGRVGGKLTYKL